MALTLNGTIYWCHKHPEKNILLFSKQPVIEQHLNNNNNSNNNNGSYTFGAHNYYLLTKEVIHRTNTLITVLSKVKHVYIYIYIYIHTYTHTHIHSV